MAEQRKKVGFLLLGGIHHILHLIPPAAELAKAKNIQPIIYTRTDDEADYCRNILSRLGAPDVQIKTLKSQALLAAISAKLGPLLSNRKELAGLDAIIVAERTSTLMKRLPDRTPPMIHIPHGAGDRAKSYDPRIKYFDHVIVAGPKDKRRMIEMNVVKDKNCSVSGYLKTQTLDTLYPKRDPLFKDKKPVVLYNPHFDKTLSSWWNDGQKLLKIFAAQDQYNFVFAPHIRLFANASETERKNIEAFKRHPHMIIDPGSKKSTNMAYTRGADIYLGDVSSQVYEFLSGGPKPCLFLAHGNIDWQNDPDYAHWKYGPVFYAADDTLKTLRQSISTHDDYKQIQITGVEQALGNPDWNARQRAAQQIMEFVNNPGK